jgi:SAM-dependent methyltransferase
MRKSLPYYEMRLRIRGLNIALRIHTSRMFVPNLVSLLSASVMRVMPGGIFCDVCSGSGLHAILAAKLGAARAYGVDVNPLALKFARLNARLNGVADRCRFLPGDLVAPLAERGIKADCLTFTGPQCPASYANRRIPRELRTAVNGGPDGSSINVRFVREVKSVLAPGGRFYQPTASWARPGASISALKREGFVFRPAFTTRVPVWGRGNNSRAWFIAHPGRRRVRFNYPEETGGFTRILEVARPADNAGPEAFCPGNQPSYIDVDFRAPLTAVRV